MSSVLIEFLDNGQKEITSRRALRRIKSENWKLKDSANNNLLQGRDEIMGYAKFNNKNVFYDFVRRRKFPAKVINSRWYAHKENIDQYFKDITKGGMKEIPEGAE